MRKVKIGLLQGNFCSAFEESIPEIARIARRRDEMGPEDFRFNQDLLITLARKAAEQGAQLVVGPESYLDGWSNSIEILKKAATSIPGPETDELCAIAQETGLWMCVCLFEESESRLYNASVLISSDGKVRGVYRKTHETKDVLSRMPYSLGDDLSVFETPWGTIGMLICHDRWYSEAARTLRRRGAELILNPVATAVFSPHHKYHDIQSCVLRAHAYENAVFFASCCGANHGGHSAMFAPDGTVVAEAGPDEQVLVVEADPSAYSAYDFVSNLRNELYRHTEFAV